MALDVKFDSSCAPLLYYNTSSMDFQLYNYILCTKFLLTQSAQHSCRATFNDILHAIDCREALFLVLDLSDAFDTVSHKILTD